MYLHSYVLRADRVSELLGCSNTDFVRARALLRERRELSQQRTSANSSAAGASALDASAFGVELPSDSTTSSSPVASSSFSLGVGVGTAASLAEPSRLSALGVGTHVVPYPALSEERAQEADRLSSDQIRFTLLYMGMPLDEYISALCAPRAF